MTEDDENARAPEVRRRMRILLILFAPVILFSWLGWDAHQRDDHVPVAGVFWPLFWLGALVCTVGPWVGWWRSRRR